MLLTPRVANYSMDKKNSIYFPNSSILLTVVILFVASSSALSSVALIPALASISESAEFSHISNMQSLVGLILGVSGFFVAIGAPLIGWLSEYIKKTHILVVSMLTFAIAGSAGFYLNDIYLILVSRAFVGLSVAGIVTMNNTLIGDYFTGEHRYKIMGLANGVGLAINIVYGSLAGILLDIGWRYNFLLFLIGAVLVIPIYFVYQEPKVIAHIKEEVQGSAMQYPLIVFILFTVMVAQCMFYMPFIQLSFVFKAFNSTGGEIALALNVFLITAFIGSVLYSAIRARLHFIPIYGLTFLGMGCCLVILGLAKNYETAVFGMFLGGFFFGWLSPNSILWLMQLVSVQQRGRYIGWLSSFWYMAVFLSPVIFTLANLGFDNVQYTLALVGGVSVAIGIVFLLYKRGGSS